MKGRIRGCGATATKGGNGSSADCWKIMTRLWTCSSVEKALSRKISGVQLMPWVLITQRGGIPHRPCQPFFHVLKRGRQRHAAFFDYIEFNNLGNACWIGPLFRATSFHAFCSWIIVVVERAKETCFWKSFLESANFFLEILLWDFRTVEINSVLWIPLIVKILLQLSY